LVNKETETEKKVSAAKNQRQVSLSILYQILEQQETLTTQFDQEFSKNKELTDLDKRFVRHLVKGTLQHYFYLSGVLNHFSKTPVKKMKPVIRCILLQATEELLFMETADYAAVSEALKLLEKRKLQGLKGFVNGVLRNIARNKETLENNLTPWEKSFVSETFYQQLAEWYGVEKRDQMLAFLKEEEKALTVSLMSKNATTLEEIETSFQKDCVDYQKVKQNVYEISNYQDLTALQAFQKGYFYVQDQTSYEAADTLVKALQSLSPTSTDSAHYLDLCAAPGGKTFVLYNGLSGAGNFLSCDLTQDKVNLIEENKKRLHFEKIQTLVHDATHFEPAWVHQFDAVIADVPCSGLGIIKEKPDILIHINQEENGRKDLLSIQEKIIENAVQYVKPQCYLLFSTCTLDPQENHANVEKILKKDANFHLLTEKTFLPGIDGKRGFFLSLFQKEL